MPTIDSDARGPFGAQPGAASGGARRGARRRFRRAGGRRRRHLRVRLRPKALLQDGVADFVAAARQSLADPDWFRKIELGRGAEVRRCEFTNYCEALDQHHKQVTCQLWDREALDGPDVTLAADGKRRLVAPGWR
jgi:hypothetical protein